MPGDRLEEDTQKNHCLTLRWKVMLVLSAILIALGLGIEWAPPQDPSLPDTSSFLVILGIFLGVVGLLTTARH
ncbi:MAG: hypothetical protein JSS38_03905 [Nitrospira sp.]|nr:hypothetical protein [Nitrospira sp.]MBS0164856.1 hypothetical protein [Nitrospira sp.]